MTRMIVRGIVVSFIILAVAVALRAQSTAADPATANNSAAAEQHARITSLLVELAEDARASDNAAFAARAQMQAALLLWPRDREQARSIFRRAFSSLAPDRLSDAGDTSDARRPRLTLIERQQLRGEMLNRIAGRDPELAEELARALADSIGGLDCARDSLPVDCESGAASPRAPAASASPSDVEQRELLMSVALQIVERAPQRAMALAQLSLSAGISQNFARLLVLLRAADAGLADLLFASALARLEQSHPVELSCIHELGSYLVSAVNSPAREAIDRRVVARFLSLAFNQISRRAERAGIEAYQASAGARREDASALYFIGRQLTELFARYHPARLGDLRRRLKQLGDSYSVGRAIKLVEAAPEDPVDSAGGLSTDDERDRASARAALTSVANGEIGEAQTAALKIADPAMRDRVLAQVVRLQLSKKCFEDALALARSIDNDGERVDALVMLAAAALSSKNNALAAAVLNEAEGFLSKARPTVARAQALLKVVGAFSSFDSLRSFEVMQTAIKVMNEATRRQDNARPQAGADSEAAAAEQLQGSNLEATLETLARVDFDRTLQLAQQIADEEAALIAQLAACRGGLAARPVTERQAGESETRAEANH
jgi:hypothetical protein